ncbi:MAG: hypothetical protein IKK21_01250 [Clostridia bacterium]|nr:hypothetical protein [Clostridia bacterium]
MKKYGWALACVLLAAMLLGSWRIGSLLDLTAEISLERVCWQGRTYSPVYGAYTQRNLLALGRDGWMIRAVEEDPSHTFIAVQSFRENALLAADDYAVPTEGELTAVAWHGRYITDAAFLAAMAEIDAGKTVSFTWETPGIDRYTDNQQMRRLYFAYDHCPVATNAGGYMGRINGAWVITLDVPTAVNPFAAVPDLYTVDCYVIPEAYGDLLSAYFQ